MRVGGHWGRWDQADDRSCFRMALRMTQTTHQVGSYLLAEKQLLGRSSQSLERRYCLLKCIERASQRRYESQRRNHSELSPRQLHTADTRGFRNLYGLQLLEILGVGS